MSSIPQAAIDAVALPIHEAGCGYVQCAQAGHPEISTETRDLAETALEAAEQAWPHEPPKRDLTGTTTGQFGLGPIRAPFRRDAQPPKPKVPFGFGTEVTG